MLIKSIYHSNYHDDVLIEINSKKKRYLKRFFNLSLASIICTLVFGK